LWLQKKGITTNFFSPLSFAAVFGSGIRDPGWVKIFSGSPYSGQGKPLQSISERQPLNTVPVNIDAPAYSLLSGNLCNQ
jgi:hypothetical protein